MGGGKGEDRANLCLVGQGRKQMGSEKEGMRGGRGEEDRANLCRDREGEGGNGE